MSHQRSFFLAALIMAVVTLLFGLPRWLVRKWGKLRFRRRAASYLKSMSEEERDYLKMTEVSLLDAWGEEDDHWDRLE